MMPARVNGSEGSSRPTPRVTTEDGMLIRVRAFAVHIFAASNIARRLAYTIHKGRHTPGISAPDPDRVLRTRRIRRARCHISAPPSRRAEPSRHRALPVL